MIDARMTGMTFVKGRRLMIAALIMVAAQIWPAVCGATNLRGQVLVTLPTGQNVPRAQALVELFPPGYRGPAPFSTTTGPDGLYYFQNVGPGQYQIWINRSSGPYMIEVGAVPYQDIAPVLSR